MPPFDWSRLQELLAEAVDLPVAERSAFLDRVCGDDRALRTEVETLLAAEPPDDFLRPPSSV